MEANKKKTLKICIIGESGVGKTSLIVRYIKGKFNSSYKVTIGADLFSNEVTYNDMPYVL